MYLFILVGLATIPAGGGGTFLGGCLVKNLDLRCRGILNMYLFILVGLATIPGGGGGTFLGGY